MPMSESTRDLRVFLKFKNARLLDAIDKALGDGAKISDVAELCCVSSHTLYRLISLTISPFSAVQASGKGSGIGGGMGINVNGIWYKPSAIKIAKTLGRLVEDIFPKSLYELKLPNKIFRDMDSVQLLSLQEARAMKLLTDCSYEPDFDGAMLKEDLDKMLKTLGTREELVLRLRFGLGGPEFTFSELADRLKVSTERLRQIEARALRKLRHPSRSTRLRPYYEEPNSEPEVIS